MKVEKDFEDFVKLLNKNKVKYLIVGSYATAYHSEPRNTGDIDFFIQNTIINSRKIIKTIKDFGFEGLELKISDFQKPDTIIQLGYPPNRIDIITSITGVKFNNAYKTKIKSSFGKEETYFISLNNLLKNKKETGRKKDLADIEVLEKYNNSKK